MVDKRDACLYTGRGGARERESEQERKKDEEDEEKKDLWDEGREG